jgi:N-acyl-D-amino-acid deacylase
MRTSASLLLLFAASALRADDAAVRPAIEKGLKRLEAGVKNYPTHRQCFSCHHQAMAILALSSARARGFVIDEPLFKQQVTFSLKTFRNKSKISKGQGVGGDSTGVVYALHTFAAADRPHDDTSAALVEYLLVKQRQDGSWPIAAFGDRPPTMGSLFTNAGLAMYVLKKYGPADDADDAALAERIDAAFKKGRDWLIANKPRSTEDRVFQLRGLVDSDAVPKEIEAARAGLLKEQRDDGGWSQLAHMGTDAYATATALVSLRAGGLKTEDAAYQKGVRYLLKGQAEDGAWTVKTRSRPLQVFFDNGDPGGKSQFISFAATGWSVLALLETLPAKPGIGQ